MNYVFVYNPNAGLRSDARLKDYMTRLAAIPAPNTYQLLATTKKGDAERYARETAERYGTQAIVIAVGGDGTLSEVANGLVGTDTPLLVLPAGRGNDFSRTIYIGEERDSLKILDAVALLRDVDISSEIKSYEIDLMSVRAEGVSYPDSAETNDLLQRYCINAVSIGFDSNSVIASDRLSRKLPFLGNNIYYAGALISSFKKMKFRFNLRIDESSWQNRAYSLVAICNARYYGSGFLPNPKGHLKDGYLEVIVSKPIKLWHVIMMASKYKTGRITELKKILDAFKGKEIAMESSESDKLIATIDGDVFYCDRIEIKSVKNKLKLILPKSFRIPDALT